ncbi:MAG: ATP-binding protein [Nitrospirota bacterium]
MAQCLLNLLKNAIEAISEGGRIWVNTSFTPEISGDKEGSVTIEIGDTGSGISKGDLQHIFKPFFSLKKEGHGLGLYLCRQIVERHNGKLTARSEEGKGSVFTITLPVKENG